MVNFERGGSSVLVVWRTIYVILFTYPLNPREDTESSVSSDSQTQRERIRQALESAKSGTVTVLSSLLVVEDAFGYVFAEAIEEIAEFTHTTINDVWGIASFYTNFRFDPPTDHTVEVCWGPTCHLQGAPVIIRSLLDALGLESEGDTNDGRVNLKYNTCLGACAQAPVLSINHKLVGRVTSASARNHIEGLQNTPRRSFEHNVETGPDS